MGAPNGNLQDPLSGGLHLPTGIVSTTVDTSGVTLMALLEGRPFVIQFSNGAMHLQPQDVKDATVATMPMAELARLWAKAADQRIVPVTGRA